MHLISKIHQHTSRRKRNQKGRQKYFNAHIYFSIVCMFFTESDNNVTFCRLPKLTSGDVFIQDMAFKLK
jgi:hypothetical protein